MSILNNVRKFILGGLILLLAGSVAFAVTTPSRSVIHPYHQTLLVPDNSQSPAHIKAYSRTANGWGNPVNISLAGESDTAKIYGMAINGTKLYVSINDGNSSKLRKYILSNGIPSQSNYSDAEIPNYTVPPSPAGMAVIGSRIYVADMNGRLHIFKDDSNGFNHTSYKSVGNLVYDVAVTTNLGTYRKIYVSQMGLPPNNGKIYVFKYHNSDASLTSEDNITANLVCPTYLKVSQDGSRLFVADIGSANADILKFNTSNDSFIDSAAAVNNPGTYFGFIGFDITPDGEYIYFSHALDANEYTTNLYRVEVANFNNVEIVDQTIDTTDALVISSDREKYAATYSWGGLNYYDNTNLGVIAPIVEVNAPGTATYGTTAHLFIGGKYFTAQTQIYLARNSNQVLLDRWGNPSPVAIGAIINGDTYEEDLVIPATFEVIVENEAGQGVVCPNTLTINFSKPVLNLSARDDAGDPLPEGGQIRYHWDLLDQEEEGYIVGIRAADTFVPLNTLWVDDPDIKVTNDPNDEAVISNLAKNNPFNIGAIKVYNSHLYKVSDIPEPVYTTAAKPANLEITSGSSLPVALSWDKNGNPSNTDYIVQRKEGNGSWQTQEGTIETTFTDDTAESGTTYTYRVQAENHDGVPTDWIESDPVTPEEAYAPVVVTPLQLYKPDGTEIPSGGFTNSSTMVFRFDMDDQNESDTLTPMVKIDALKVSHSGDQVSYDANDTHPFAGEVIVEGIAEGGHDWKARVKDSVPLYSTWEEFPASQDGFVVDITSPEIASHSPAEGEQVMGLHPEITITFSDNYQIDQTLLNDNDNFLVVVLARGLVYGASTEYNASTKTVTLNYFENLLLEGDEVTIVVNCYDRPANGYEGVKDLAGNLVSNGDWEDGDVKQYRFTFTIAGAGDTTPPQVISTIPENNDSTELTNPKIAAVFDEAIDENSIEGNFSLVGSQSGHHPVTGFSISDAGTRVQFNYIHLLTAPEFVTCTLTGQDGITDLAGNPLAQDYTWTFMVAESGGDQPIITLIYPNSGLVNETTDVVIQGDNFAGLCGVKLGEVFLSPLDYTLIEGKNIITASINPADLDLESGDYYITVFTNYGASKPVPEARFTVLNPGGDTTPPEAVTNFDASDDETNKIVLTWDNPSDGDLDELIIIKNPGSIPQNRNDGGLFFTIPSPVPGAINQQKTDMVGPNQTDLTYGYAIFSKDSSGNWNENVDTANSDTGVALPAVDNPPSAFGKVAPINGGQDCCEVRFKWNESVDPDGTLPTYYIVVRELGSGNIIVDVDTMSTTYTVPNDGVTFIADETYEWNVSASDGSSTVWADGAEGNTWTFTYIEGIVNPDNPQIISTSPNDDTLVASDTPIVITFSESMLKESVESVLQIVNITNPNVPVTGLSFSWNPIQTELTITHDAFMPSADYEVTVGGTDLTGNGLVDGPVPNPFTFTVANQLPNDFSKIAPLNNGEACCEVRLEWENNGDPDVNDSLTYHVIVNEVGGANVIDTTVDTNSYTIALGDNLTPGQVYEWNVSATDGNNVVWADGAEDNKWTFTYIDGVIDPNPPQLTITSPVDSAADVDTTATIVLTFSESMIKESVESSLQIAPEAANLTYSWNSTQTELTISHDELAAETSYQVTVGGTDLTGDALIAGPVANPFSFTTGQGAGDVVITNPTIGRDGDNVNDSITISWQTDPVHSPVRIYTLERAADYVLTAEEFNTAGNWTEITDPAIIESGDLDRFTDANQVGTGTQKYYAIIPQNEGVELTDTDLTTNVVAKFDLTVGPEPEKFFLSIPLAVADTALDAVIGGQAMDLDFIAVFDIEKNVEAGSMRMAGNWEIFGGAPSAVENLEIGYSYGYFTITARYITVVGNVRETDLTRTLTGNSAANWIANPYPYGVNVAEAGLNAASFDPAVIMAAMAVHFDADANAIGGTNGIAFHYAETEWREGNLQGPSPLIIAPGRGYMLLEPGETAVDWTISR